MRCHCFKTFRTTCFCFVNQKFSGKLYTRNMMGSFFPFVDVNECNSKNLNRCNQMCNNTAGSYFCRCQAGYELSHDKTTCKGKENININSCNNNNMDQKTITVSEKSLLFYIVVHSVNRTVNRHFTL